MVGWMDNLNMTDSLLHFCNMVVCAGMRHFCLWDGQAA